MPATLLPKITIQMFGNFTVLFEDGSSAIFKRRPARWILALLLLEYGRDIEYDSLAYKLWPQSASGNNNLHQNLRHLRDLFTSERFDGATRQSVRIDLSGLSVDLYQFEAALAMNTDEGRKRAVALYHGPLLADCTYPWADAERVRFRERYKQTLIQLVDDSRSSGNFTELEQWLRRLMSEEPDREEWVIQLVTLLQSRDGAAAARAAVKQYLNGPKKRDLKPGSELQQLYFALADVPATADTTCSIDFPVLPGPLTPLIGRETSRSDIVATLLSTRQTYRTVLIQGRAGVGKTQLALLVATEIQENYPGRVAFVELTTATNLRSVQQAILGKLEIPGRSELGDLESICTFFGSSRALLVLDNCDSIFASDAERKHFAEFARTLLSQCPNLRLLITSQTACRSIPGLKICHLSGLAVPPASLLTPKNPAIRTALTIETLEMYPASDLYLREARNVEPDLSLSPDNLLAIVRICHFLDGLPLGIILAARLTRLRSPSETWNEITADPRSIETEEQDLPARHRNLWRTVRSSYEALSQSYKEALVKLASFDRSWTRPGALAVLNLPMSGLNEVLDGLMDNSLISRVAQSDPPRFSMPEIVHRFAHERLIQSQHARATAQRHLEFYTGLAEEAQCRLTGPEPAMAQRQIQIEESNLLAALEWTDRSGSYLLGLRLATALGSFWYASSQIATGIHWLSKMLGACTDAPCELRRKAIRRCGHLAFQSHAFNLARQRYTELLDLEIAQQEKRGIAVARANLANLEMMTNDLDAARQQMHASLEIFTQLDERRTMAQLQGNLGMLSARRGDLAEACRCHLEAANLFRSLEAQHDLIVALNNLADTHLALKSLSEAAEALRESFALTNRVDYKMSTLQCLFLHCKLATEVEAWDSAARLMGVVCTMREVHKIVLEDQVQQEIRTLTEQIRSRIGTRALEQALQYVAEDDPISLTPPLYAVYDAVVRHHPTS